MDLTCGFCSSLIFKCLAQAIKGFGTTIWLLNPCSELHQLKTRNFVMGIFVPRYLGLSRKPSSLPSLPPYQP